MPRVIRRVASSPPPLPPFPRLRSLSLLSFLLARLIHYLTHASPKQKTRLSTTATVAAVRMPRPLDHFRPASHHASQHSVECAPARTVSAEPAPDDAMRGDPASLMVVLERSRPSCAPFRRSAQRPRGASERASEPHTAHPCAATAVHHRCDRTGAVCGPWQGPLRGHTAAVPLALSVCGSGLRRAKALLVGGAVHSPLCICLARPAPLCSPVPRPPLLSP